MAQRFAAVTDQGAFFSSISSAVWFLPRAEGRIIFFIYFFFFFFNFFFLPMGHIAS